MTIGESVRRAMAVTVAGALVLAACGSGGGSVEAFCESAQKFVDLEDPFEGDPEAFADGVEERKDAMNAMIDDAPSEISDDVEIAVEIFVPVLDALADVDPTDEDAVSEAFASLDEANPTSRPPRTAWTSSRWLSAASTWTPDPGTSPGFERTPLCLKV